MLNDITDSNEIMLPFTWLSWLGWIPTSAQLLELAEKKMFQAVRKRVNGYFVPVLNGYHLRTIEVPNSSERCPVVMLHGFASGLGWWSLNIEDISEKQKVYAIDLLGFGRSSRPVFPEGAAAERMFIQSLEDWRKKRGLEKFILLGHSFGAYLSCSYSLEYPQRVRHLILVDPWGVPEKAYTKPSSIEIPMWARVSAAILSPFNPLAVVRAAGPFGPYILSNFRHDLRRKFEKSFRDDDNAVLDYLYHCNAQYPSGEAAFKSLSIPYGWAKFPMVHRIQDVDQNVPMTILYGSRSWIETTTGHTVKYLRKKSYVDVQIIKGAGHHLFLDKPKEFNKVINTVCERVANDQDRNFIRPETFDDDFLTTCQDPLNEADEPGQFS